MLYTWFLGTGLQPPAFSTKISLFLRNRDRWFRISTSFAPQSSSFGDICILPPGIFYHQVDQDVVMYTLVKFFIFLMFLELEEFMRFLKVFEGLWGFLRVLRVYLLMYILYLRMRVVYTIFTIVFTFEGSIYCIYLCLRVVFTFEGSTIQFFEL